MNKEFLAFFEKGKILNLKISPQSKENKIIGFLGEEKNILKISVKGIRENGKANKILLEFLSEYLGITKENIEIISGTKSKDKKIIIKN